MQRLVVLVLDRQHDSRGRALRGLLGRGAVGEERQRDLAPEVAAESAAAAVVLAIEDEVDEALHGLADRCLDLGLEVVVRIRDDEELERVLEHLDPEIVLLSAERAVTEQAALDRLLELLPDVPAGKLAIAELADASREDVEELERAGVDAVLVTGDVGALVGDGVPDV